VVDEIGSTLVPALRVEDAWKDWLHAQVLGREAEALLKKESGAGKQESEKNPG